MDTIAAPAVAMSDTHLMGFIGRRD